MKTIETKVWKADLPEFREKTEAFYKGEMKKGDYKKFSGYYGSYAQRSGQASMLRLRMPAGRMSMDKMAFIVEMIRKYQLKMLHFTTCQTVQLHDLSMNEVCEIMEQALDAGIVTIGGGGDFPRNAMSSPLSGLEEEYFDVLPWAEAAGTYLLSLIKEKPMPRKLKVGFSNSPRNLTHATYRDLGFAAREDGTFDVYSAGGLGNSPKFGVKVAEGVEPEKILYYVKAMWLTFLAYGNYENRGKARTRYMQEALGGPENYRRAYLEKLEEVFASKEELTLDRKEAPVTKKGGHVTLSGERVIPQKQPGLYAVAWHPVGGIPDAEVFCRLWELLKDMEEVELRLSPDETAYIVNLTGEEGQKVLELTEENSAQTLFETSVSCIGASICQVGVRDSQGLLKACVEAVREAKLPGNALPQIHISGCPSSCGTHQTGSIGFRGGAKAIEKKSRPGYVLYVNGEERQGAEAMGKELGFLLEEKVPVFLVKLGQAVAESGQGYPEWNQEHPGQLEQIAEEFLIK